MVRLMRIHDSSLIIQARRSGPASARARYSLAFPEDVAAADATAVCRMKRNRVLTGQRRWKKDEDARQGYKLCGWAIFEG